MCGTLGYPVAMGIPVYATEETIALAESQQQAVPDRVLQAKSLSQLQWLHEALRMHPTTSSFGMSPRA